MKTLTQTTTRRANRRKQPMTSVHFEHTDSHAESVCIAGTFNNWHPNATPMTQSSPGLWQRDLDLPPGTYEYSLIVDGHWKPDPHCEEKVENSFGGLNSVLRVPTHANKRD